MVAECPAAGQCAGGSEHSYWVQILEDVTSPVSTGLRSEEKTQRRRKRGKKGSKLEEEQGEGLLLTRWEDLGGNKKIGGHKDKLERHSKGGREGQILGNRHGEEETSDKEGGKRRNANVEILRKAVSQRLMMSWWGQGVMTANMWTREPHTQTHKHTRTIISPNWPTTTTHPNP